jgi:hypothetical protein
MAPVAAAAYATIGATMFLAIIVGAVAGAAFWKIKHGLVLGGPFVVGAYLLAIRNRYMGRESESQRLR